jgi:hypothetical protein
MPIRGELVGDAYVRIHADSRFIDRAIRRDLERSAKQAGDTWLENFDQEMRDTADRKLASSRVALMEALVSKDFDQLLRKSGMSVDRFVDSIRADLVKLQRDTKSTDKAFSAVTETFEEWAEKAKQLDLDKKMSDIHTEAIRVNRDYDVMTDRLERARHKALDLTRSLDPDAAKRLQASINDAFSQRNLRRIELLGDASRRFAAQIDKAAKAAAEQARRMEAMHDEALRLNKDYDGFTARLERARRKALQFTDGLDVDQVQRMSRAINAAFNDKNIDRIDRLGESSRRYVKYSERLRREEERARAEIEKSIRKQRAYEVQIGRSGTSIQRMQRNLEGMSHRGGFITDAITTPLRLALAVGRGVEKVFESIFNAGGGGGGGGIGGAVDELASFGGKSGVLAKLAPLAKAGASAVAGLAAVFVAIATVVPIVVSGVWLLVGAITAVVSAVSFGLIGTLLPLGPMLLAAAAGAGALVLGITGITKAQRKALRPLKDWAKEIGKLAAGRLFDHLESSMTMINELLHDFAGPLVLRSASALNGAFRSFLYTLEKPAFKKVLDRLSIGLPKILGALADGFLQFSAGLLGFFTPILPYAQKFADAIDRVATRFADWASSAKGQREISDFMERAWRDAKLLWTSVKNVGSALAGIFDIGESAAGKSFLQWLADITGEFSNWVHSKKGRDAITQWFKDAKDFGKDAVKVIGDIGRMLDDLDTASSRQNLKDLMGMVDKTVRVLQTLSGWMGRVQSAIDSVKWDNLVSGVKGLGQIVAGLFLGAFHSIPWGKIGSDVYAGVRRVGDGIVQVLYDASGWKTIKDTLNWFKAGYEAAGDLLDGLTQGIGSYANRLWGWVKGTFESLWTGFKDFFGISSPSTLFYGAGRDIVQGFINGIASFGGSLWGLASGPFVGWFNDAKSFLQHKAGELADLIPDSFKGAAAKVPGAIASVTGKIGGALDTTTEKVGGAARKIAGLLPTSLFGMGKKVPPAMMPTQREIDRAFGKNVTITRQRVAQVVDGWAGRRGLELLAPRTKQSIHTLPDVVSRIGSATAKAAQTQAADLVERAKKAYASLPGKARNALSPVRSSVVGRLADATAGAGAQAARLASDYASRLGQVPGRASRALSGVRGAVSTQLARAASSAAEQAARVSANVTGQLAGISGRVSRSMSGVRSAIVSPLAEAAASVGYYASLIGTRLGNLGTSARNTSSAVQAAIAAASIKMASGGIVSGPRQALIGEAGPEAVVPLRRPLSQVDPAVRALSAIAQGLSPVRMASGGVVGTGSKSIIVSEGAVKVVTAATDGALIAHQVLDRLVAELA